VDAALAVVFVVAAVFYCWTAATSFPFDFREDQTDVSNRVADGILKGQASYPVRPPSGLLRLPDPYDPGANERYRGARLPGAPAGIHDLSLYKGTLYSSWGIAPVLVLFLPWRLLPGGEIPQSLAVAIFCVAALGFSLLLLRLLTRRLLPNAPAWAVAMGGLALAFGSAVPFLLRRPAVYEVAIASGACFLAAGLYLLARALLSERPRLGLVAAASLCFGLAFNARPPLIVAGGILLGLTLTGNRLCAAFRRQRVRLAAALLAPFALCLVLTLAWNAIRFDSPFEFGQKYQLAGVEVSKQRRNSVSYLSPGIYYYAFAPPRLTLAFPYVVLPPPPGYPGHLPAGYPEPPPPTGGVIPTAPIVLFTLALPFLLRRCRSDERMVLWIAAMFVGLGMLIMLLLAFTLWTSERYEVDFVLFLILGGALSWLALLGRVRATLQRGLATLAGTLMVWWAIFCGVGISFTGYDDLLAIRHPKAFTDLENLTAPLPTLATVLAGRPLIAGVQGFSKVTLPPVDYTTHTAEGADTRLGIGPVTVTVYAPRHQTTALKARVQAHPCGPRRHREEKLCSSVRTYRSVICSGKAKPIACRSGGRLVVLVRSPDRPPVRVPAVNGIGRFPVHLTRGLNRIRLELTGAIATVEFNDIQLAG
jgi:hypothetical protein